jgi:hypothetical protein
MWILSLMVFCFVSSVAYAGPSEAELKEIERRAVAARADAMTACEENYLGTKCTKYRQEFSKILGASEAMQEIALDGIDNMDALARQRSLAEFHAAEAAKNCRNSQFFSECQRHLDALDAANAYVQTFEQYVPADSLANEVAETRAAAVSTLESSSTATSTSSTPPVLCDSAAYGGICLTMQQHLAKTAESCADSSAGAQCKSVKDDLVRISDEMQVQAAADSSGSETSVVSNP